MRCEMHKLRIIKVRDLLDLTTPFHDICILARVGIASTYLKFGNFACIFKISGFLFLLMSCFLSDTFKHIM